MMLAFLRRVSTQGLLFALGLLLVQMPAVASTFGGASPVDGSRLSHIRGGFGVQYNVGDLSLALDLTQITAINGEMSQLIQGGLDHTISSSVINGIAADALTTVIQNSLDNQVINTVNVMNITLTSNALAQAVAMRTLTQGTMQQFMR